MAEHLMGEEVLPNTPLRHGRSRPRLRTAIWQELLKKLTNSQSLLDPGQVCHQPVAHCRELCLVSCLVVYCSASQLEFCVLTPPNHSKRFAHVLAMISPRFPAPKK